MQNVYDKQNRRVTPRRQFTNAEKIVIAEEYINAVYNLFEKSPKPQPTIVLPVERRSNKLDRRKK